MLTMDSVIKAKVISKDSIIPWLLSRLYPITLNSHINAHALVILSKFPPGLYPY